MDFLHDILNLLGVPQITWAMIFAILGYLAKTIVDHYAKRRQTVSELQAKSGVEQAKEQEAVRVSMWSSQGLLPKNFWVLMPRGRRAFAQENETVVTHGGMTLDEMIVPLIQIRK